MDVVPLSTTSTSEQKPIRSCMSAINYDHCPAQNLSLLLISMPEEVCKEYPIGCQDPRCLITVSSQDTPLLDVSSWVFVCCSKHRAPASPYLVGTSAHCQKENILSHPRRCAPLCWVKSASWLHAEGCGIRGQCQGVLTVEDTVTG